MTNKLPEGIALFNNKPISLEFLEELITVSPLALTAVKFVGCVEIDAKKQPNLFALIKAEQDYLNEIRVDNDK